jgi:ribosomal protein S18 acetylase RimI-like enzyme
MSLLLQRIEDFYDAVPRSGARAESHGGLTLFVREGSGWPYYARPTRGAGAAGVDEVLGVRERQRELGVPEAFEWLHDLAPWMAGAAEGAGLDVRLCPLLVLDADAAESAVARDQAAEVRVLTGDEDDLATAESVAHLAFAAEPESTASVAERDALAVTQDEGRLGELRRQLRDGTVARVAALAAGVGPVSVGGYQHAMGVAEIVGVGTLPAFRRRGLGAAVTARLAELAVERGLTTVFLSAADDAAARVYEGVGFRRIGTAGIAEPFPAG